MLEWCYRADEIYMYNKENADCGNRTQCLYVSIICLLIGRIKTVEYYQNLIIEQYVRSQIWINCSISLYLLILFSWLFFYGNRYIILITQPSHRDHFFHLADNLSRILVFLKRQHFHEEKDLFSYYYFSFSFYFIVFLFYCFSLNNISFLIGLLISHKYLKYISIYLTTQRVLIDCFIFVCLIEKPNFFFPNKNEKEKQKKWTPTLYYKKSLRREKWTLYIQYSYS